MTDLNRVLIVGGSGMVGSQVPFGIKPQSSELDMTDERSVERAFGRYAPSAAILLAGITDMKKAEEEPEEAMRVNVGGARNIAKACNAAEIALVFFSTCVVFDGNKSSPYDEEDQPNPTTVYGRTKYMAENEILRIARGALVIRTGWLFGGFSRDRKFIKRFIETLRRGKTIFAVNDRFGSPTYVPDLIAETTRQLSQGASGIRHVVNDGVGSYYDVALKLRSILRSKSTIEAKRASEFDPGLNRGPMEALASKHGSTLRPFEQPLIEYCAGFSQHSV